MANQIYGYNPSSYGAGTSYYSSRTVIDPYHPDSSFISSSALLDSSSNYPSMYMNHHDGFGAGAGYSSARISAEMAGVTGGVPTSSSTPTMTHSLSQSLWPPGVDVGAASFGPLHAGAKRSADALYHQTYPGTNNTFGQSEALYSTKHPRLESTSHLPIYPQRPGEKDCAHYMLTRTCRFGDSCKFDHPSWVPEGGIPDWKEVQLVPTIESLPERPGEDDCPYFLKTKKCKFGIKCKFNHPKDKINSTDAPDTVDVSLLPERPSEPPCSFYMKTGKCKFGASCKFHHPKDIQIPVTGQENGNIEQTDSVVAVDGKTIGDAMLVKPYAPFTPALLHNSKGLPVRPGEVHCPFYLKTGSCKYGATCRYNHPDRFAINPPVAAALGHAIITSPATNLNIGFINPAASILPTIDPRLAQATLGLGQTVYPQRPGQIECDFYMKTGDCKFGERCKFHHPIDRSAPTQSVNKLTLQQNIKLTLAGLPRREGAVVCPFYMKTGTCKYSVNCRFDHPPPGEAVAMATVVQGETNSASAPGDVEDNNKEDHTIIQEQQQQS
ncbi:zinc finger protein [Macleaya cordata]|uniref:Zinc finger protein n=1 Tax=Macleaya cordata TaxID=56857 RepID=A0A200QAN4_MACCD|nr:zinc finger protein [Macleaya cordata]